MRGLLRRVKVDGDAEGHADLIRPGVAPPDGSRGVVHFVRHAVLGHRLGFGRRAKRSQIVEPDPTNVKTIAVC